MSNMITKKGFRVTAAGVVALAVVAAGATSAEAKGRTVIRSGGCDNSSATWKLKAQSDDGRIEVEFKVDANRVGQTWAVRMGDDGHRFFTGTRTTAGASGSFTVNRRIANRAGTDTIRITAGNADLSAVSITGAEWISNQYGSLSMTAAPIEWPISTGGDGSPAATDSTSAAKSSRPATKIVSRPADEPWPRSESACAAYPRAANHGRKYGSQHQASQ